MTTGPALVPIRVSREPVAQPPVVTFDDALELSRAERAVGPYVQGSLALELVPDPPETDSRATSGADLPEPRQWAGQVGLAIAEALVGVRPPTQLVRWTTPEVYAVIARRAVLIGRRDSRDASRGLRSRPRPRILVRRVHVCVPADGVAEASVVLQDGPRVRAMALRLSGFDGRWRVEALQVG